MNSVTAYPLTWPLWIPRTQTRRVSNFLRQSRHSSFGYTPRTRHTIAEGCAEIAHEVRKLGGKDLVISSNLRIKLDGMPIGKQSQPADPGVAIWFDLDGEDLVFACDRWHVVEDNLWAVFKHLEAMVGQDRWGVGTQHQAFTGYAALPAPSLWYVVLEVPEYASPEVIRRAYLRLVQIYHPDKTTGDVQKFMEVQSAYEEGMRRHVGKEKTN